MKKMFATMGGGHLCVGSCTCRKDGSKSTAVSSDTVKTITDAVARAVESVKALQAPSRSQPSLAEQVAEELKRTGNELVVAFVDEEAGTVSTFLEPATNRSLSPEEARALEAERTELLQALPTMPWVERVRSEQRIKQIQRDLDVGRFNDESDRRKAERVEERRREYFGR